jgi:hypothetical protein
MEDREHERRKVACTIEITKGARLDRRPPSPGLLLAGCVLGK